LRGGRLATVISTVCGLCFLYVFAVADVGLCG
jgi:hypothetical protein